MIKDNETQESAQETLGGKGKVSASLAAEIGAGVESVAQEVEQARQAKAPKADTKHFQTGEAQPVKESGGKAPDDGKNDGEPEGGGEASPDAVTDEHIERAIKAGIPVADARSFKDAKALERVCSILERKSGADTDRKADDSTAPKVEPDPLAAIPDLNPDEYDEQVVAGFKAMKDIIRGQLATISELKQAGGKASVAAWFDGQITALGDALAEGGPQAAKRTELQDKFDILTAGYKAAGKTVEPETVFKEAVKVVLGDVEAKASSDAKAASLAKRQGQHLARPSGNTRSTQTTDAFADVAADLDKRFFKK
jgi:hypothetical protein